jgi:hypothetical protein
MPENSYAELLGRDRVNVRSFAEIELWTDVLDVYVADLVMAVAEVGNRSADVLDFLLARKAEGIRSLMREPSPPAPGEFE